MRAWYSSSDFVQAAAHQRGELQNAIAKNEQLRGRHQQRRHEVVQRYQHALHELLASLLPNMSLEARTRAADLTGYLPLVQYDHAAMMAAERAQLEAKIAAIESDPRFVHREFLRAPRIGKLTREVDELLEYRGPLAQVLAACQHPRMEHLVASGYGTPDYAVPFWRMSYYHDWEAADQVMASWPDKTFAQVGAEYVKARDTVHTYDARIRELRAEIAQGEALEIDHRRSKEALASLEHRHLARARQFLGRHLVDCGFRVLGPRLGAEPGIETMAKRVSGLGHKLTYLDQLTQAHLDKADQELRAMLARTERDIMKYQRPKYYAAQIPAQVFQQRFRPRGPRYQKVWHRYEHAYDTVYGFDRYDTARLAGDFLWWDLMTDGRIDGDFLPEVYEHRRRNPSYRYVRPRDDDDDFHHASAATARGQGFDHGPLVDPS